MGSTYWLQSIQKNDTTNFCLLAYLRSYNDKSKFLFLETVQPSYDTSYLRASYFCVNFPYHFLANIPLYIGKISWKNYVRFWKWNLNSTPQLVKNSFLRKSNSKFCFIFNMISFVNAQGSVKIRLACSKAL